MKFERQGEWMVGTPIYVGPEALVAKAMMCKHEFAETPGTLKRDNEPITNRVVEMAMDRCGHCVASRARYRYTTKLPEE